MTSNRRFFRAAKNVLRNPPGWAAFWIFCGTYAVAAIILVLMVIAGTATPVNVLVLVIVASLLPWFIYWAIMLALLAGALALGAILYLVFLAGRAWRGEQLFQD